MNGRRREVTKAIDLPDREAVRFWTKELKCTEALLRTALRNAGPSTDRVRAYLAAINTHEPMNRF